MEWWRYAPKRRGLRYGLARFPNPKTTVCPYSYQKGLLPLTVCPYKTDTFFYWSQPRIVNYDPKNVPDGVEVKKAFPFRPIHFYSYPAKALEVLDWQPKHDLLTDMQERFAFYKASGRGDKEMTFETDDKILNHAR
jgi:hypothetical protein